MRKLVVLAAALLVLAAGGQALALQLDAGLRLGYVNPTGDLGDDFDGGMSVGLAGEVVSGDFLAVEAALSRAELDMKRAGAEEAEMEKWLLELNGKVYFMPESKELHPFVKGGIVTDFWDVDALDRDGTNFGLDGGVGLSFNLTENLSLGGEAAYYYVWSDRGSDMPLGYDSSFWNLFFSLTFRP